MSELTAMAEKLTKRDGDGAIQVAGFVPSFGFYENAAAHFAPSFGATWFKADGTSNIGSDPGWASMMTWQKELVDFYGYDKLQRFTAGLGQEFSADNAFEKGKVAMKIDGEYRNAFIKAEAPSLDYGTAPFPSADDKSNLYGSGYVTGNVIGIGRGSQNPEAAWALIKFLTTDTDTVVALSNGIKNVPTWTPALQSPNLVKDATYSTFLDIFANENSATTPTTASGKAYQDTFGTFVEKWQAGKVQRPAGRPRRRSTSRSTTSCRWARPRDGHARGCRRPVAPRSAPRRCGPATDVGASRCWRSSPRGCSASRSSSSTR